MMKLYSMDLRDRVIAAVEGRLSCHSAAAHFGVAPSTAVNWVRPKREKGSAGPDGRPQTQHYCPALTALVTGAHR